MNNNVYDKLPTDTPPHILKKQVETIQSLSYSERLRIACGLSDFCYQQTMNMLRKKLGTTDEKLLKIAFVETVYKNDFSKEELYRIKLFFNKKD
ncbi:MAG: hypothetical protein H0V14_07290 [Chitinophagaceae bacterium]|nr:hypothetical protein [Chitinophagaceae bacterium]